MPLPEGARVEVRGQVWSGVTGVWTFTGPQEAWSHVFYRRSGEEVFAAYPSAQVRVVTGAEETPAAAAVLDYWRTLVSRRSSDDPLRRPFEALGFIHPESALAGYLNGAPVETRELSGVPIYPFRCNLSQRQAVHSALTRCVSVIEGPPGTGKTETILNLVANIMTREDQTVGVVSFNNAAVDNVREKLDELGFGHGLANLGRAEKKAQFFSGQAARNARVTAFTKGAPTTSPDVERLARLDRDLHRLQEAERSRAELRSQVDAYRLELGHFERHLRRDTQPDLAALPLLRRSSERILEYLAETEVRKDRPRPGLVRRVRQYVRFGSLRGLDPADTAVLLELQRAFYVKRIAELDAGIQEREAELRAADFDRLVAEHQQLSVHALRVALGARYRATPRRTFEAQTFRQGATFQAFMRDYPVVLSTCHSLQTSIAAGHLLDYLIIDESSQVDLLAAALALASCRNLVVVGDLEQLPHIPDRGADGLDAPAAPYDAREHNILSSLIALHGERLPRTLLREHYRCDPTIIGYCNKSFYGGRLVPYTSRTDPDEPPMVVVRTVEGNHHRRHRDGGRSNRREVDVIRHEVIPTLCQGVKPTEIGITTPYRRQVDAVTGALIDAVQADTVHKFQGRQKDVVILTTVLDETWRGQTGLRFVDDPHLVNVAVSRAVKKFILVTNHDLLPRSRYLKDLIGYIQYQQLDEKPVDSAVVSVFDLLYREYSDVLGPLAARLKDGLAYKSEAIIWTLLLDILGERGHAHLAASRQVLLRNLFDDRSRLTPPQDAYVRRRASVDFVVHNRVTNQPLLAIEVDGFAFHEDDPKQLARDALKDEIFRVHEMPLLRLPTTGSGEEAKIRRALDEAEVHWAEVASRPPPRVEGSSTRPTSNGGTVDPTP